MAYHYTKPRGPVAAMYTGPGPCYGLPTLVGRENHDPRSEYNRAPSFGFGLKHGKSGEDCGPGPVYFPDLNCNRTRSPQANLVGRREEGQRWVTPGPLEYDILQAKFVSSDKTKPPAYSFGLYRRTMAAEDTPGPQGYSIECCKERAPCYSLVGKRTYGSFHQDFRKTPGPGAYTHPELRTYLARSPCFSMSHRNEMNGDTSSKPGPGQYNTSHIWASKRDAPRYSFGIRHSPYVAPLILNSDD